LRSLGTGHKPREESTTSGASSTIITLAAAGYGPRPPQLATASFPRPTPSPHIDFD